MDRQVIVGTTDVHSAENPAARYLLLSNQGRVGTRFREVPPEERERIESLHTFQRIPEEVAWALGLATDEAMPDTENAADVPTTDEELQRRIETALRHCANDPGLRPSTMEQAIGLLPEWVKFFRRSEPTYHVFEVTDRRETGNEIIFHVQFLGEGAGLTIATPSSQSNTG